MGYILYETKNHIATITLDRPKALNAFSTAMANDFLQAFELIKADHTIYCVIIKSDLPHAFTAGGDIKEESRMDAIAAAEFGNVGKACVNAIEQCPVPVIMAVHGYTLGAGFELALGCDIVVAADDLKLGIPTITLGEIPSWGGTQRLPRLVGKSTALDILLTGRNLDVQEAHSLGIVQYIVEKKDLLSHTYSLATSIADKAPLAIRCMKKAVHSGMTLPLDEAFCLENRLVSISCSSEDRAEAMQAFLEKRLHKPYENK